MPADGAGEELTAKLGYERSLPAAAVQETDIPSSPGVFVWYHDGTSFFVGAAQDLGGVRSAV